MLSINVIASVRVGWSASQWGLRDAGTRWCWRLDELTGALAGDSYRICSAQAASDHLQRFAVTDGLQQRQISAVPLAQAPGLSTSPSR